MAFNNDADIRFQASLEDNISPNLNKLERQLKAVGATPQQIKMTLKAVDEATPKIKEAKRQVDQLPRQHNIHVSADTAQAKRELDAVRMEAKKPIRLEFVHNLNQVMSDVFSMRQRVPIPMAGSIPGASMLYAGGPVGLAAGAGAGVVGMAGQGVAINARMEQSLITLEQTLKDQTKATSEMNELVKIAQKTPFSYSDVLAGDVRLRSYQMPTMKGEGGPGNQGWLQSAGNMAAAMGTPLQQAVEAVADARQGYFVRMMTYGIRMMREDFEKGGKYAGLSYEQGLERAIRRFEGSMEMQSKSFTGVMSNLKDIAEQSVLKPIGEPAFNILRQSANQMQDRMNTPEFQEKLANSIEKVQHMMYDMWDTVKRGKQYFEDYMVGPLTRVLDLVSEIAIMFGKGFAGTVVEVLKTVAAIANQFVEPFLKLMNSSPEFIKLFGAFKALSMLGFTSLDPIKTLLKEMAFFGSVHPTEFISALVGLPKALASLGLGLVVKNLAEAAQSTKNLKEQFHEISKTDGFKKMNDEIRTMAHGLDQSTKSMQDLVSLAGSGLPDKLGDTRRMQVAMRVGRYGAALEDRNDIKAEDAIKMMTKELSRTGRFGEEDIKKTANEVRDLGAAAKTLNMSFSEVSRVMGIFAEQAGQVGLAGTKGAPFLAAMSSAIPDRVMRGMFQQFGRPSLDTYQALSAPEQMGGGARPPRFSMAAGMWDWRRMTRGERFDLAGRFGGTQQTYEANVQADKDALGRIRQIAPGANLPSTPNPFLEQGMGVRWGQITQGGSPREQARRMMEELERQNGFIEKQAQTVAKLTDELNKWTNWQVQLSQATDDLNMQMQKFQRTLMPLQQQVERMGYQMAQFQFDNLRPLERALQRLGNESTVVGNKMREAQRDMNRYSQGMLDGEQATQDHLYALEKYNKELQLLQLQYSSIGAQLGRATFDRGASVRVAPLMGLNLQMQMERNNRRIQKAQLEQELTYGDQRHQLELASRTRNERREMSFEDRMAGIKRTVPVIDELTEAQNRLARKQGAIQEAMMPFNETLADMQDNVTELQLRIQKASTSRYAQGLQTQIADLGIKNSEASKQINLVNVAIARQESIMDDVKDNAKGLTDQLVDLLVFDEKNPESMARKMIENAYKSGTITQQMRQKALKRIGEVTDAMDAARKEKVRTDQDWVDIIKRGVMGVFGDTWRDLGARLRNLGRSIGGGPGNIIGAGGSVIGGVMPYAMPVGAGLVGAGMAGFMARQAIWRPIAALAEGSTVGRAISDFAANRAESFARRADRAPAGSRRQRFWMGREQSAWRLAEQPARILREEFAGGRFWRGMGRQFNLARRALLTVSRPASFVAGMAAGPMGAFYARRRVTNFFEERSVRQAIRDIVKGGDKMIDSAAKMSTVPRNFRTRIREAVTGFKEAAKMIRLRGLAKFGDILGKFGVSVGVFDEAATKVAKSASKLEDVLPDKVPKVPKGASSAVDIVEEAGKAGGVARGIGKFLKWGGRGAMGLGALSAGVSAFKGDWMEAGDTASYLLPYIGPGRAYMDLLKWGGNKDYARDKKRWEEASDSEKRRIDPARYAAEQAANNLRKLAPGSNSNTAAGNSYSSISDAEKRANEDYIKSLPRLAKEYQKTHRLSLQEAREIYDKGGKLPKVYEDFFSEIEHRGRDHDAAQRAMRRKEREFEVEEAQRKHRDRNKKEEEGYKDTNDLADKYLDKLRRRINRFRSDMGLAPISRDSADSMSSESTQDYSASQIKKRTGGAAHGEHIIKGVGDSKGVLRRVGEEGDEMIIPLVPHRRERAKSLVRQTAALIGMANGGMVDQAYLTAKGAYDTAKSWEGMANGGRVGAAGSDIIPIPGNPGKFIHRRILPQLMPLLRRFKLRVTDGFAKAGHANNSDHYWGGAVDLVPGADGNWDLVDALAKWAEPRQGSPRFPFRWVGYDGDEGHGRGNHLHLSWSHAGIGRDAIAAILSAKGGMPGLKLPGVPRGMLKRGIFGRLLYDTLRKQRRDLARSAVNDADLSGFSGGGDAAANIRLGQSMAREIGWTGRNWAALRTLWMGESGWRTNADNPSSDAYGIPQAMTNLHSLPADYKSNPATQIAWGLNYIKGKYGDPASALAAWRGRSPHWYAPGIDRIETDRMAFLHAGERVQNAAEAATTRSRKGTGRGVENDSESRLRRLMNIIEDIQDKIKKTEQHLKKADDRAEKRKGATDLAALNAQLRQRFGQVRAVTRGAGARLRGDIMAAGDDSGGESTEALVDRERRRAQGRVTRDLQKDRMRVRRATTLQRSASRLARTARTPRQRRLATTAVKATGRAVKAARAVTRFTRTARGRGAARELARRGTVQALAKRGRDPRLVRAVTGRGLTKGQTRAYERVRRASKTRGTADDKRAQAALRKALNSGLSKQARELQKLRGVADRAGKRAASATSKAARSQGKHLDRQGRLINGVRKATENEGKKARAATKGVADETKRTRGESKKHDDKRTKAEINADRREREFQKKAIKLLEGIESKDLGFEINNKAEGAKLSTTVIRTNKRKR